MGPITQSPDCPVTRPSDSCAAYDDRAVLRSEAQAIAQRGLHLGSAALVGDDVEIARRIRVALIDRRREESARQGERRGDDAGRAARALRMANHRLHRRPGKPLGMSAEY